jgi:hypothetical protein
MTLGNLGLTVRLGSALLASELTDKLVLTQVSAVLGRGCL